MDSPIICFANSGNDGYYLFMEKAKEMLVSSGKLALKVTPRARTEGLEDLNAAGELVVKVRAAPEDGKANEAVIALISEAFSIPRSRLEITRGATGRRKTITYLP